jgi:hypothetical protein
VRHGQISKDYPIDQIIYSPSKGAMQEELNNFTCNNVWVLEPPPRTRTTLAPNGSSAIKKISMDWWFATRQDLWPKTSLKLKGI